MCEMRFLSHHDKPRIYFYYFFLRIQYYNNDNKPFTYAAEIIAYNIPTAISKHYIFIEVYSATVVKTVWDIDYTYINRSSVFGITFFSLSAQGTLNLHGNFK